MPAELTKKEKIAILSNGIIAAHKGQAAFNFTETAKIIKRDRKFVAPEFDDRGILAIQQGDTGYFTAVAIAEYLYDTQVSPLKPFRNRAQAS